VTPVSGVWSVSGRVLRPYRAAGGRRQNCLCRVQRGLRCPDGIPCWRSASCEARMREGWSSPVGAFPGGRPAASGHLLRSGHHPRCRPGPAAAPRHVATPTGAWPGGSCSRRRRPGRRRRRHAGLARSLSRSSVVLDVSVAGSCWRIQGQARSCDGRRVLIGMPGAAGHPRAGQARSRASRQPGSSDPGSQGSGAPKKRSYQPRPVTGQQPEGPRRLASRPVSPGVLRRA